MKRYPRRRTVSTEATNATVARSVSVPLSYDSTVSSHEGRATEGCFDCSLDRPGAAQGKALPAEMLPHSIDFAGVKFALRDDDACYFTAPEKLTSVYHDVWDRVPVCLATVPFAIGYQRLGIPPEHWTSGEAFPLERNAALWKSRFGDLAGRLGLTHAAGRSGALDCRWGRADLGDGADGASVQSCFRQWSRGLG